MISIPVREESSKGQYRTPDRLSARISLHEQFSRDQQPWQAWVFDHLQLKEGQRILEAGCGTGKLWEENRSRIPRGLTIYLTDYSSGMLSTVRRNLQELNIVSYARSDAQTLPFESDRFDLVIANHMLYHVPDVSQTVNELARVLKPGGQLLAATNGLDHMAEIYTLLDQVAPGVVWLIRDMVARFGLENGAGLLSRELKEVTLNRYDGSLWVTQPQPLVDYILSLSQPRNQLNPAQQMELERLIAERIEKDGGISIRKSTGLFSARK